MITSCLAFVGLWEPVGHASCVCFGGIKPEACRISLGTLVVPVLHLPAESAKIAVTGKNQKESLPLKKHPPTPNKKYPIYKRAYMLRPCLLLGGVYS